jgi:vacuolar-type H+-ATPase catalytic subunit A/Vma1
LQQNSFTKYDRYCPFYKSVEMMRNIATFHRLATAAVERTAGGNAEVRLQEAQKPGHTVGRVMHPLRCQAPSTDISTAVL